MHKDIKDNTELITEIRKLRASIPAEDVLSSRAYKDYLVSQARIALGTTTEMRSVSFQVWNDENSDITAFTSGELISNNTLCPLVNSVATLAEKDKVNQGKMFHEVGHRFFTDFAVWNEVFDSISDGTWYKRTEPDNKKDSGKALQTMQNRSINNLISKLYHSISNIFEDEYIEWRMRDVIAGEYLNYLQFARKVTADVQIPVSESINKIESGEMQFLAFVLNSWLVLASHSELKGCEGLENHPIYQELLKILDETEEIRSELATEKDTITRAKYCNELLCVLLRYVNVPEDHDQNSNSKPDSDRNKESSIDSCNSTSDNENNINQSCESDLSQTLKQIQQSSKEANGTTSALDMDTSNETDGSVPSDQQNSDNLDEKDNTSEPSSLGDVYKKLAEESLDSNQNYENQKEADAIQRNCRIKNNPYMPWKYKVEKTYLFSDWIDRYDHIYDEIKPYSMRTSRMLEKLLTSKIPEGVQKGYSMGRFSTSSYISHLYTRDGKAFSRYNQPEHQPDVAFGLLIDQSGSMEGDKIECARSSAIMFADILNNIGISHIIVGHDSDYSAVCNLHIYHDFNGNSNRDQYKLVGIGYGGFNMDGAAIGYCCEKLKSRPEKEKILIVITDGQPSEIGFHTEETEPYIDTAKTIKDYEKKIHIFGAVIDGDMDVMKYMYGDRVFDLCDLNKLPVALNSLIKRFVKR